MLYLRPELINDLKLEYGLREGVRVTYEEIARYAGVSTQTILRYAKGQSPNPDTAVLNKVAEFFGVEPSYFLAVRPAEPARADVEKSSESPVR